METVKLDQLTCGNDNEYLLGQTPFSGFAIEMFPYGGLQTQISLMRGVQDGIARCWHPNGQLKSDKAFRNGAAHGQHQEWRTDGVLTAQSTWNAGTCVQKRQFDERGWLTAQTDYALPGHSQPVETTYRYYDAESEET